VLPPWVTPPPPDADPYLPAAARVIQERVTHLELNVYRDRPAWSASLGTAPYLTDARREWLRQAGIVAAYREQHQITDNDPARPLGAYQEPGQPGRAAYWQAAAAITTARDLAHPARYDPDRDIVHNITDILAGRTDQQDAEDRARDAARERAIAHQIAVDTYLALPEAERAAVVTGMIARRGSLWYGPDPDTITDPGTDRDTAGPGQVAGLHEAAIHPAHAPQLHLALTHRGHLSANTDGPSFGLGSLTQHRRPADPARSLSPRPMPPPQMPQPRPGPSLGL
jgi:hypothetical protein